MNAYFTKCWTLFFVAALAAMVCIPGLRAQSANRRVESRLLLVFDTSSAMKKREPAEEKAVRELFAITLYGQFHAGDSIGVWTFGKDLRTGEYPLQYWEPQDIITIPQDIIEFLKKQHYSKKTSFDELMPVLNRVAGSSPRLTVVIFCDGEGEMHGSTADDTVNTVFKDNLKMMQKKRAPFVIVLRSQFGKYTGCTISTPDAINVPEFPPLPPPPVPPVKATPAPAPPPPAPMPLIIIGRNVGTNLPPPTPAPIVPQQHMAAPAPAPSAAPTPAPANPPPTSMAPTPAVKPAPVETTSATPPAPETNATLMATAGPATPPGEPVSVPQATPHPITAPVAASESPESVFSSRGVLLSAGVGLLVVAGTVFLSILRRAGRRSSPSLITESLKKR